MIFSSDNAIVVERQLVQLKNEIDYLTAEVEYKEKKLEKLRSNKKK